MPGSASAVAGVTPARADQVCTAPSTGCQSWFAAVIGTWPRPRAGSATQRAVVVRVLPGVVAEPAVLGLHRDHGAAALARVARRGAEARVAAGRHRVASPAGGREALETCSGATSCISRVYQRVQAAMNGSLLSRAFIGPLFLVIGTSGSHAGRPPPPKPAPTYGPTRRRTNRPASPASRRKRPRSARPEKSNSPGSGSWSSQGMAVSTRVQARPAGRREAAGPLGRGARGVVQRPADREDPAPLHEESLSIERHVGHGDPGVGPAGSPRERRRVGRRGPPAPGVGSERAARAGVL